MLTWGYFVVLNIFSLQIELYFSELEKNLYYQIIYLFHFVSFKSSEFIVGNILNSVDEVPI